jgi:hypothetical protein
MQTHFFCKSTKKNNIFVFHINNIRFGVANPDKSIFRTYVFGNLKMKEPS